MGLIINKFPSCIRSGIFPPLEYARPDGLLASGGNLSPEILLTAYAKGIFPWYSEGLPILWWSPDPRCLLFPHNFHLSSRSARKIRQSNFSITFNRAFEQVIEECAIMRRKEKGTWLVPEMKKAYKLLHKMGYAQSIEIWTGNELAGGLYGICMGRCFFGESMFHYVTEASRCALAALVQEAILHNFIFIDCQQTTPHMMKMGALEIPREKFCMLLEKASLI